MNKKKEKEPKQNSYETKTTHHHHLTELKKTKAGPSPKKTPGRLPPTGEEQASGSRDQPTYDPEKSHEPKGPPGRPKSTTESTIKTEKQVTKPKPRHGTEIDMSTDETYWQKQNLTYIKDQLDMRNWRGPKIKKMGQEC